MAALPVADIARIPVAFLVEFCLLARIGRDQGKTRSKMPAKLNEKGGSWAALWESGLWAEV
jgi:hypothetical protein